MEKKLDEPKEKCIGKKIFNEVKELLICFIVAYILYLIINYFFGTISCVRQTSMYPTAIEGERVTIQRSTIFKRELNYGDIIIFEAPINEYIDVNSKLESYIAKYEEKKGLEKFVHDFVGIGKVEYIKRVIGLPGDHIEITAKGEVYRNDEKITEEYLQDGYTVLGGAYFDVIVPEGCIYVMGDNRSFSKDSRYFGCIPLEKITGYVGIRVWPFNRFGNI